MKFSDNASVVQTLLSLADQPTKNNVCQAIEGINAINNTNIAAGISTANSQISSAPNPKAMVLLSDGMYNRGGNPLSSLPSIPIYTIALGNHGQLTLMQQIATNTSGKYNYAPGVRELAQIYNDIVSEANVADAVTNDLDAVSTFNYKEISSPISAGAANGKFTVNWDNEQVQFTSGTPVGNQVNIALYDPSGTKRSDAPVYVEPGVAVFDVDSPQAGNWSVGCWYAGKSGGPALNCVWGGFEPPGTSSLSLAMTSPTLAVGDTAKIKASFKSKGSVLENPQVQVRVNAPLTNHEALMKTHEQELKKVSPNEKLLEEGFSEDKAKLLTFARKNGIDTNPRTEYRTVSNPQDDGTHKIEIPDTKVQGGYKVQVTMKGYSPELKSEVKRTRLVHFNVE